MSKPIFSPDGKCLIGSQKGIHASKMNAGWVDWAKDNISGFTTQFQNALNPPPPLPDWPKGRTYILKKYKNERIQR